MVVIMSVYNFLVCIAVSVRINNVTNEDFRVQIDCKYKENYYYVDGSPFNMLEIEVSGSSPPLKSMSATCNSEVSISDLPCDRTYNISAKWKPMDGRTIKCELDEVVDYEVNCHDQGIEKVLIIWTIFHHFDFLNMQGI